MRQKLFGILVLVAAGLLTTGCVIEAGGRLTAKDSLEEVRDFEPGGTFQLKNTNGQVTVATWDEPRVRIEARISAPSERYLDEIDVEISGNSDWIEVETHLARRWLFSKVGQVDYEITLPHQAELRITTVNGEVHVDGISGEVRAVTVNGGVRISRTAGEVSASTVNGNVRAAYEAVAPDGHHRFKTMNGSVTLDLPPDTAGTFSARTVNGGISTDFPLKVRGRVFKRLQGELGDGEGRFEIRTVNGWVKIRKTS